MEDAYTILGFAVASSEESTPEAALKYLPGELT
jgi:hypothetical protein